VAQLLNLGLEGGRVGDGGLLGSAVAHGVGSQGSGSRDAERVLPGTPVTPPHSAQDPHQAGSRPDRTVYLMNE
jgi:hypothetical protein